jgi:hypothetical protein
VEEFTEKCHRKNLLSFENGTSVVKPTRGARGDS